MAVLAITLTVVSGTVNGLAKTFDISKQITIGRVRPNKFQIKSDTVSSKHAVIAFSNERWQITDLDSSNGTAVNGVALSARCPAELKNGDMVLVGVGSDNLVRVSIESPGRSEASAHIDAHVRKSALSNLTVKEWIEKEIERLSKESNALVGSVFDELHESSQKMKRMVVPRAKD